jgi:polar amino acid transport system substrate-binding protein
MMRLGSQRFRRGAGAAAAAIAVVMTLTSCGSDDDSSSDAEDGGGSETLVAAYDPNFPPVYFQGDNGETVGFTIDMQNEIADRLGIKIKVVDAKFDATITGIQGGRYDFSHFQDTVEREEAFDFLALHLTGIGLAVQRGNPDSLDIDELCGATIGGESAGTPQTTLVPKLDEECANAGEPPVDFQAFPGPDDLVLALKSGRIQGFLSSAVYVDYLVQENPEFEKGATSVLDTYSGFGFRKGDPMVAKFQGALQDMMDDGTYAELFDKWGLTEDEKLDRAEINLASAQQ